MSDNVHMWQSYHWEPNNEPTDGKHWMTDLYEKIIRGMRNTFWGSGRVTGNKDRDGNTIRVDHKTETRIQARAEVPFLSDGSYVTDENADEPGLWSGAIPENYDAYTDWDAYDEAQYGTDE